MLKAALLTAAASMALRASLGADEARELAHLHHVCPLWAHPACDALLAAGGAAQRVPGAEAAAGAALLAQLVQFCVNFGRALALPARSLHAEREAYHRCAVFAC